jgi:hypothetical protein
MGFEKNMGLSGNGGLSTLPSLGLRSGLKTLFSRGESLTDPVPLTFQTVANVAEPNYFHFGITDRNPVNGKWVHICRLGNLHVGDEGKLVCYKSNNGKDWVVGTDPVDDDNWDIRVGAGGYDSRGRLHLFWLVLDNPSTWKWSKYKYSDDDALTWSSEQLLFNMSPGNGDGILNKIIELENGTLLQPAHFVRTDGSAVWSVGYYKCTNPWEVSPTWTKVNIATTGTVYTYAEPSLVYLGNNQILCVARKTLSGANTCNHQWFSPDNGDTWVDHGDLDNVDTWDVTAGRERPPFITMMNYYGKKIPTLYWVNTTTMKFNVVYAKASDFATNGKNAWNTGTEHEIMTMSEYIDEGYTRDGYQTVVHLINRWGGIGSIYYESVWNRSDIRFFSTPLSNRKTVLAALNF